MAWSLADFNTLPWLQGAHPLEQKKVAEHGLTLLQFEPGFEDPNWCERSHLMYVLQGIVHLQFEPTDRDSIALAAGQAIWLEPGTRHRASVRGGQAALVFIASEYERAALNSP